MIEVVSHPADLSTWNGTTDRYYLELFGETQPLINTHYAEVLPIGGADGNALTTAPIPIYEYWWTIGHPGHKAHQAPVWRDTLSSKVEQPDLWADLDEKEGAAARVYVFFPIDAGWRIKELIATLKFLVPTQTHESLWNKVAEVWKTTSPLVDDASKLAGLVPGATAPAAALAAIAKLQINSVPQDAISWSVEKVTFGSEGRGVMQGILWNLPKEVFTTLGSRITGSIAVSFIPAGRQDTGMTQAQPAPARILAHAVIYGPDGDLWAPGPDGHGFIKLQVSPQLPPPSSPAQNAEP